MDAGKDKNTASVHERLRLIQEELKSPKTETGRFGKHRNVEGILESLKPLLKKHGLLLVMDSQMIEVGGRCYVEAAVTVTVEADRDNSITVHAQAWEGDISRGLDAPQVTGAASSYARKYALGGLFAIDDGKDPDSHSDAPEPAVSKPQSLAMPTVNNAGERPATPKQIAMIQKVGAERFANPDELKYFITDLIGATENDSLNMKEASTIISELLKMDKPETDGDV